MSTENALVRSTVRVMAGKNGQEPFSVGTGFYYKVQDPKTSNAKILILTNKHVVNGADYIRFVHSYADSLEDLDEHHQPVGRVDKTEQIPIAPFVYNHPNPDIDLCAIDVAAFQGSSGSPVFSYEAPMFRQASGAYTPGTKVNLIGVVWGVIESSVEGDLKVIEIPSALKHVPVMNASLNLALALHADVIKDLDALIFATIN